MFFLFSGTLQAGPLEALSEQAYKLTGKKCEPVQTSAADPNCEPATASSQTLKKSTEDLSKISQSLTANSEDKYFALLAEQQGRELQCAQDFAKSASSDIASNFKASDLKSKLTLARFAKQKAQALGKKIVSDPALATPVCPQSDEALQAQYPKGTKKGASYKACKEWIGYKQSYQAILASIPLSGSPSLKKVIDDYASSSNEKSEAQLQEELMNGYTATQQILEQNRKHLAQNLKENGVAGLDRAARNELLADPALSASVLKSNPSLSEVACHANARFGEGADNLNNTVMVSSLIMGGSAAILGKVGAFTARAFETSNLARTTGMVSLKGMGILRATAIATDFASMGAVAHQACFSDKLSDLKSANACVSAPSAAQVEKDNCLLSASLLAIGAVPQSMVAELSKNIKKTLEAERRQNTLGTLEPGWEAVAKNPAAVKVTAPKNATAVEKQLIEGNIIGKREVGTGAFGAQFVKYDNGVEGVWKAADHTWAPDTAKSEVAAYAIDNYLGLKSVPVTVKKDLDGVEGTVQYRVKDLKNKNTDADYLGDPNELGLFDYLIANGDRHGRNYLQKTDGNIVAIDHGLAFENADASVPLWKFNERVTQLEKNLKKQSEVADKLSRGDPRSKTLKIELRDLKQDASELQLAINSFVPQKSVVEKLRKTTADDWRKVVGDNLTDKQIQAMQNRQKELLDSIDQAESKLGKDRVYPAGASSPLLRTFDSYDSN
ncbi:hypothetical protein [Bdellovibrio sp. HCB209]|uniref:hypothetical protein n=1 Tax=Bdellovibrio sp. HCB209 TaxID=3394354 RepID=UPI0039B60C83